MIPLPWQTCLLCRQCQLIIFVEKLPIDIDLHDFKETKLGAECKSFTLKSSPELRIGLAL